MKAQASNPSRRTLFRPCIDLHAGRVKQIVGSTLGDGENDSLQTNFESPHSAAWFAELYCRDGLTGGHVIQLGPGNETAAREALAAWPDGLQLGGGITGENAASWLGAGAAKVIVTSWLFDREGRFLSERLEHLQREAGQERIVIDLSCRGGNGHWRVAMNRWQTPTDLWLTHETLNALAPSCAEFLIHAVDVEGKCAGMDEALLRYLGQWSGCPVTYAGGARSLADLRLAQTLSQGRVDVTIGSALDIFGGTGVTYEECAAFNAE